MPLRHRCLGALLLAGLAAHALADDFVGRYIVRPSDRVSQVMDDNGQPKVVLTVSRDGDHYRMDLSPLLAEGGFDDVAADRRVDGQALANALDYGRGDATPQATGIAGMAMNGMMSVALYRVAPNTPLNPGSPTPRVIGSDYFLVAQPMLALELERLSDK